MLVITLSIALLLLIINYIPIWLVMSSNRYSYYPALIFAVLFVGIWAYKIQTEIELQNSQVMDLKESVFRSTNRSKARMRLRYHDPWEYIYINMDKVDSAYNSKREKSALLLRTLTIDALIVLLLAYKGKKRYHTKTEYYARNIRTYYILLGFCILVEFLNHEFLDI